MEPGAHKSPPSVPILSQINVKVQGNSEWIVQKENIAVTAVMNLFHQYRYNMKEKLS
jgi:hypothetical protein